MLTARNLLKGLADLALPRKCTVCGRDLILAEDLICLRCLADLPLTHFSDCKYNPMADALNARVEAPRGMYLYAVALIYYKSGYKSIPKELKYGRNFKAGRYFAGMLADNLMSSVYFKDIDLVIPVPLHRCRKWTRGYNQAEVIAKVIADRLPLAALDTTSLKRTRDTSTQTALEGEEREKNVKDSFSYKTPDKGSTPRHILVVDDVFTSGSTTASCCNAILKKYGDEVRISVATLAYAGE